MEDDPRISALANELWNTLTYKIKEILPFETLPQTTLKICINFEILFSLNAKIYQIFFDLHNIRGCLFKICNNLKFCFFQNIDFA